MDIPKSEWLDFLESIYRKERGEYPFAGTVTGRLKGACPAYFIIDEVSHVEPLDLIKRDPNHNRAKDWESRIPDPDPFARPVSSPSDELREKLRAKRKKRKG